MRMGIDTVSLPPRLETLWSGMMQQQKRVGITESMYRQWLCYAQWSHAGVE
jgi:hypothetical protein